MGKSGSKYIVEKFKKKILEMHNGIPDFRYYGFVENLIPDKEIRDYMVNKEIFIKSKRKTPNGQDEYFLGIKGMDLANNYRMEFLTEKIKKMTKWIVGLTITLLILTLIQIIF